VGTAAVVVTGVAAAAADTAAGADVLRWGNLWLGAHGGSSLWLWNYFSVSLITSLRQSDCCFLSVFDVALRHTAWSST